MRPAGIRTLGTAIALLALVAATPAIAVDEVADGAPIEAAEATDGDVVSDVDSVEATDDDVVSDVESVEATDDDIVSDVDSVEVVDDDVGSDVDSAASSAALLGEPIELESPGDPWEGFNRRIFWFNEKVDIWVLRPVSIAWDFVLPDLVQTGIRNIFQNARFPVIFVNDILQAKPIEAGEDLGRFLVNTTVGIGGVWDPAKRIGLPGNNEDFGQTLGYWGVPPGPFLVLPVLGASNPRDTVGFVADSATMVYPYFIAWYISAAITTTNLINQRARYIEEIDENRATALDFYALQRNAYMALRENLVNDFEATTDPQDDDDLYYFEDEEESEEAEEAPAGGEEPGTGGEANAGG
jgi:phospholipid-binding lipoprotein MlaA